MHTKDYGRIAAAFQQTKKELVDWMNPEAKRTARTVFVSLALDIARQLREDNPAFDCHKFLLACGAKESA